MATLSAGQSAPAINLAVAGGGIFSSTETLKSSVPVIAAFFKVDCPTCQYTFPFLERMYKAYPASKLKVIGISQNDAKETVEFAKTFGVTFPIALDDKKSYAASNAYGLVSVPSVFLVAPDGKIQQDFIGWLKEEFEQLNQRVAKTAGVTPAVLFHPGEQVLDFKAG